jgi:hypothetical protein
MSLSAFGILTGVSVPLFLSAMHASFLLVALWVLRGRVGHLLRAIPLAFFTCTTMICLMGWPRSR